MATAAKHSPSTTPSPTSVSASPQSPNNNNQHGNTKYHQIQYHHQGQLSSPGHITTYEYSKRVQQGGGPVGGARHSFVDGNQEEISSIAKQISDHAEAIYQTWKARGLAPTEILSCQLSAAAGEQSRGGGGVSSNLDPVTPLSPHTPTENLFHGRHSPPPLAYVQHQTMPLSTAGGGGGSAALNELLAQPPDMSNNNKLEKLVNSFVNEDKARIAAQRRSSQLSSSSSGVESTPKQSSPTKKGGLPSLSSVSVIKQTLQKFENNNNNNSPSAKNFNLIKPKSPSPVLAKYGGSLVNGSAREDRNNNSQDEDSLGQRQQLLKKNQFNSDQAKKNVPDVLLDTISNTNGSSAVGKGPAKPQTPVKPPNLLNHVPSWPLKGRPASGSPPVTNGNSNSGSGHVLVHEIHIERDAGFDSPDAAATIVPKLRSDSGGGAGSKLSPGGGGLVQNKMKNKTKGSVNEPVTSISGIEGSGSEVAAVKRSATGLNKAVLEDAVKREEECLINALKTGGQVLKSSGLVSDSMLKMTSERRDGESPSSGVSGGGSLPVRNTNSVSSSEDSGVPVSDNNGPDGSEDKENSDVSGSGAVNFELSTDVAGPPPSNLAHHVPKVFQNEDGVFEAITAAQKPTVSSKMFKTRPVRSSVLETMIKNENFNAKVAIAQRDKELGINPITPFLTRGSVAERVLIFERCPEIKAPPRMPNKLEPNKLVSVLILSSVCAGVQVQEHDRIRCCLGVESIGSWIAQSKCCR